MRAWRVIGGKTIAVGVIALLFIVAALWALLDGRARGFEPVLVLMFFGSCLLLAITDAFERKQAFVGGGVPGLRVLRTIAFASFSLALIGGGLVMPSASAWLRAFLVIVGAGGVVGTIVLGTRHGRLTIDVTADGVVWGLPRATLLIPWRDICDVGIAEISGNVALGLRVCHDDGRPRAPQMLGCRGNPQRLVAKQVRAMSFSAAWYGWHWFVMQAQLDRPIAELEAEIVRRLEASR